MRQLDVCSPIKPTRLDDAPPYDFPADWHIDVAKVETVRPLPAPQVSVAEALLNPLHSLRLDELVGPGDQVCIAFTLPSIACPDHILVPALLHELEAAGVYDEDILLLCASNSHGCVQVPSI